MTVKGAVQTRLRSLRLFRFVVTLIFLTAGPCLSASCAPRGAGSKDAFSLVARALRAKQTLSYTARQDIEMAPAASGGPIEIVADIVRRGRQFRLSYLMPLEAAHRIILDDGSRRIQYEPSRHTLIVGKSRTVEEAGESSAQMLALLHRNYACARLRREAVSGRWCDVVSLRPRYQDGPWRVCWIDVASHAILRTEEYDAAGCRLYASWYEMISIVPRLPVSVLVLPPEARRATTKITTDTLEKTTDCHAAFAMAGVPGRVPAWLPSGYSLIGCGILNKDNGVKAAMLRYGDGLNTVSLFEEPEPDSSVDDLLRQQTLNQALSRYGEQAWVHSDHGVRITTLGDMALPTSLGAEIMASLSPQADHRLLQGIVRDFGAGAARQAAALRQAGWGYDRIAALCLKNRQHGKAAVPETEARRWVAATLANPH